MRNYRYILGMMVALVVLSASVPAQAQSEPIPTAKVKGIEDFHGVLVNGPLNVTIEVGDKTEVFTETSKNGRNLAVFKVKDGILHIHPEYFNPPINLAGLKSVVIIKAPKIDALTVRGTGDMHVKGLAGGPLEVKKLGSGTLFLAGKVDAFKIRILGSGDLEAPEFETGDAQIRIRGRAEVMIQSVKGNLMIDARGSGDAKVMQVDSPKVDAQVNGASKVELYGKAEKAVFATDGSGDIKARGLVVKSAKAETNGTGDITLTVTDALTAEVSDSGTITYFGNPAEKNIEVDDSGAVVSGRE